MRKNTLVDKSEKKVTSNKESKNEVIILQVGAGVFHFYAKGPGKGPEKTRISKQRSAQRWTKDQTESLSSAKERGKRWEGAGVNEFKRVTSTQTSGL